MPEKIVCQLDDDGYLTGLTAADESPLEPGVWLYPARSVDAEPPSIPDGHRARWVGGAWVVAAPPAPAEPDPVTPPTQFELDQLRYRRRAAVQADLMSRMAADNMSRVRAGTWTVPQLTALMDDPAVKAAQTHMATLSYELAAQSLGDATTPLLTPEIKAEWIAQLTAHFYLDPLAPPAPMED